MKTLLIVVVLAAPWLAHAQGQSVWRCGPDGRTYSDTPCADGRQLAVPDARPVADVRAAQEHAERERRLAERQHAERMQAEAQNRGNGLAGFVQPRPLVKPAAKPQPRHRLKRHHPEDDGTWQATAPASRRAKG